jgi:hypothetical protein
MTRLAVIASHAADRRTFYAKYELPHIGAEQVMRARYCQLNPTQRGMQMRTGIGIAVVVAIGLIWSVAAMSKWVPVAAQR